jgi:hypothetical protein
MQDGREQRAERGGVARLHQQPLRGREWLRSRPARAA